MILAALGMSVGHISEDTVGLITLVALITIASSTYLILYSHQAFERLNPLLKVFERKNPSQEQRLTSGPERHMPEVIIFGLGRYGGSVAEGLREAGWQVLLVDFDPILVRTWEHKGLQVIYGDADDPDFFATLPTAGARWVISTIPDVRVNRTLIQGLRHEGYKGRIAVTSHYSSAELDNELGDQDLVLLPYRDAAAQTVQRLVDETR